MIELIAQHQKALHELCARYDVSRLDLIGSAVRGDFDAAVSDLDFVVDFTDLTVEDAADRYLGLLNDLEDLFQRRIDLISYSAIRNPIFRQIVDGTRVQLYAA